MCDSHEFCSIFAYSLFGIRLMIYFQIRNERFSRILQYFRTFLIWKSTNARFPNKECAIQQRRTRFLIGKQPFSWRSPPWCSFLIVKRAFDAFYNKKMTGIKLVHPIAIWGWRARRPSRTSLPPTPRPGNFFIPRPPHTQTDITIDFINPACQLLGKKNIQILNVELCKSMFTL